ncbi:MAG: hypothetical protein H0S85_10205 [Desulfovibrionaceae bacterium]|nr:hypothetical protein [Desulfovibrionaceae bacterium]
METMRMGLLAAVVVGALLAAVGVAAAASSDVELKCVRSRDSKELGAVAVRQSFSKQCTPTTREAVARCNEKYANGCEGRCWLCWKKDNKYYACWKPDGSCEGSFCSQCK